MRIVIPGGSGHVGAALRRHFAAQGHEVIILSRNPGPNQLAWDGKTLRPWAEALEGADVVINLAGRTVNCRYHAANLRQMMDSRPRDWPRHCRVQASARSVVAGQHRHHLRAPIRCAKRRINGNSGQR